MADRSVPLDGDGEGEVDGAGEADVSHGEEDGDELEEVVGVPDHGENLWEAKDDHGEGYVKQVVAGQAQQEAVEVFLENFSAEQENGETVANNTKAANRELADRNHVRQFNNEEQYQYWGRRGGLI